MVCALSNWLIRVSAGGLVLMTGIIGWQVFGRFVLGSSPSWSEQGAMVLMIWYILFAAAAGVYEGFHIRIALLEDLSSPRRAKFVRQAINVAVMFFGLVLLIYGAQLVYLVWDHVIPSLFISRGFAYIPLPVSGGLMALFALFHLRREWRGEILPEENTATAEGDA